mgnify:CR=1 FL=1
MCRHISRYTVLSVLLVMTGLLVSCGPEHEDEDEHILPSDIHRAVVVYMVAENNLSRQSAADMREMLDAIPRLPADALTLVYIDDLDAPRLYALSPLLPVDESLGGRIRQLKTYMEEVSSASGERLHEVLADVDAIPQLAGVEKGLVLWSHGTGWQADGKATEVRLRSAFGMDNGHNTFRNTGDMMSVRDMNDALSAFPSFRFIFFDACLMQTVETVFELRHRAAVIAGSPAEIPREGCPYGAVLPQLLSDVIDWQQVLDTYNEAYEQHGMGDGVVLSAVRTDALDRLFAATQSMLSAYGAYVPFVDLSVVNNYFIYDEWKTMTDAAHPIPDGYDMDGFMYEFLPERDYQSWKTSLDAVLLASARPRSWWSAYPEAAIETKDTPLCGMSMYLPIDKYANTPFPAAYEQMQWSGVWK